MAAAAVGGGGGGELGEPLPVVAGVTAQQGECLTGIDVVAFGEDPAPPFTGTAGAPRAERGEVTRQLREPTPNS